MSNYNLNSGYGQITGQWPFLGGGKVMIVGASAIAARSRNMIDEIMKVDPDGEVRFYGTIDAAVSGCVADRNDVVYVLPGHAEEISGASAINLDISGMSLIGLGNGENRPQISLGDPATTTIVVDADDIHVENITFKANFADVATCFELEEAKQFTVKDCSFLDAASGENFLVAVRTSHGVTGQTGASACDGLTVDNCTFITPDLSSLYFVHIRGSIGNLTIKDNYVNMGVNTNDYAPIMFDTGVQAINLRVEGNRIYRRNDDPTSDLFIDNDAPDNTGIIANNFMLHNCDEPLLFIDCEECGTFENYSSSGASAQGVLNPAADVL